MDHTHIPTRGRGDGRGPRRLRRSGALALVAGFALIGGLASATAAGASTSSPSATSKASASAAARSLAAPCATTTAGRASCKTAAIPASKLPAGAKDTTTLSTTVSNPAQLVDTRTWTSGGGNTFPGADVPFGMVQWSPDTMPDRNAGGGYNYGDSMLTGYSLTHLSGPGCGAAEDVPILPMTGSLPGGDPNSYTTSFTNTGEVAQAGYYSAESNLPSTITSQFTETTHSAMGRFTFPKTNQADFLVKLMNSQNGDSAATATVVGDNEIQGSDTSGGFCGGGDYTVYFDITFDQPFTASQVVNVSGDNGPGAVFLTFDTSANQVVQAKVGISYVSVANAKLDVQTENSGWNFNSVKTAAQNSWNTLLNRFQVSGGAADKTQQFYSNLYKILVQPNVTSDVNGQYFGSDGKVHTVSGAQKNQYGMFSGWDTYHAVSQLQAIIDPQAASDQAQSLVNYYAQNGILQQWGYLNLDNYVMVGDPADSIISDYYAFGARNFDTKTALTDMVTQATTVNGVRPGEALEQQYGYLPEDGSYGCCDPHGQVSSLLEYDTADFALSQYASALGDTYDSNMLAARSQNWVNVFDSANDLLTPRMTNGTFEPGVGPTTTSNYVEGDAYEYLWDVPNDYAGLFSLLGGDAKVAPELEQFLSQPNAGGMYAFLANEFGHGEQFAPDYAGDPAGTQQAVNNIRYDLYNPGPAGLPNNDDLGAMSAQYVWEMLGMYPENPGSDNLVFASPGFPKAVITLPSGKKITINAPGASPTKFYVSGLKINGSGYSKLYVPFSTLAKGSTLDWTLSSTPTSWGAAAKDAPPSYGPVFAASASVTPGSAEIQPGASAKATLSVTSASGSAETVNWTASAPSGVTVSPTSGTLSVPANGTATAPLTVTGGSTDGAYQVTISMSSSAGKILPVPLSVIVAKPGDLTPFYNVTAISDDANPTGDFDGDGFSYSLQALAAAGVTPGGTVTSNGRTYTWPDVAADKPDAIMAGGQTILVSEPAGTTSIGFIGSAINAGTTGSQGTVTVNYTDGTTSTATLGFTDWTLGGGGGTPQFGNATVANTPYRDASGGGSQQINTYLFSDNIPVDGSKTVQSVTLPSTVNQGSIGVFAISNG